MKTYQITLSDQCAHQYEFNAEMDGISAEDYLSDMLENYFKSIRELVYESYQDKKKPRRKKWWHFVSSWRGGF